MKEKSEYIIGWFISLLAIISIYHSVAWMNYLLGILSILYLLFNFKKIDYKNKFVIIPFFLVLFYFLATLANYELLKERNSLKVLIRIVDAFFVFLVLTIFLKGNNNFNKFTKVIKIVSGIFLIIGFIEVYFNKYFHNIFLIFRNDDGIAHLFNPDHTARLLSVCNRFDPNYVGFMLAFMGTFYLLKLSFQQSLNKKYILLYILFVAGIFLTGSRGAMIILFIANILVLIIFKKYSKFINLKNIAIFLVLIFCIGAGFNYFGNNIFFHKLSKMTMVNNYKKGTSDGARLEMINASIHILKERPILGIGIGGFNASINKDEVVAKEHPWLIKNNFDNPHNYFLTTWIESGLGGVLCSIVFFAYSIVILFKNFLKYKNKEACIMAIAFCTIMIANIPFEFPTTPDRIMFLFLGYLFIYFSDNFLTKE